MGYIFNFPPFHNVPHEGFERLLQCNHIIEEGREAAHEAREDWSCDACPSMEYVIELMDVIHATETALRGIDPTALDYAMQQCIEKNAARGYYEHG